MFYPEASSTVVFVIMVIVLLIRPASLFGKGKIRAACMNSKNFSAVGYGLLFIGLLVAPLLGAYPVFVMKLMCFALFACAFNLLLGYTGMLSFGHAAFLGGSLCGGPLHEGLGLFPEVSLLLGTLSGGLLGLVVGFFAIRRQGIYSTMITLALAQMLFFVALQAPFTGARMVCRACHGANCSVSSASG